MGPPLYGIPIADAFQSAHQIETCRHLTPDLHAGEWLLVEWPKGEEEPTKYWLSTLPKIIAFDRLVDTAKLRWRVERDYQELKQEVGLGRYEGPGWRGFHHHITLSIAAYGFLVSEMKTVSPSGPHPPNRPEAPPRPRSIRGEQVDGDPHRLSTMN